MVRGGASGHRDGGDAFLFAGTGSQAQNWNVKTDSWFVAENWTPATVPTPNSIVTVTNGGTAQVVGATANAGNLTIGSASTVQMGTNGFLNVTLAVTNSGNILGATTGVTLTAGSSITNNATGSITAPAPATGAFTQGVLVSGGPVNIDTAGVISGENGVVFNTGPIDHSGTPPNRSRS